MKKLTKLSVIFILSLTFACNYSDQKEFYISPYGNDSSEATFEKSQWRRNKMGNHNITIPTKRSNYFADDGASHAIHDLIRP